jgi:hypothetical protein
MQADELDLELPEATSLDDLTERLLKYMPAETLLYLVLKCGWDVTLAPDRRHIRINSGLPECYTDPLFDHESEIAGLMQRRFLVRNWRFTPKINKE